MCVIIGDEPVSVADTSIFARHLRPGWQLIVYSMRVFSSTPTAMILPIPIIRGCAEDAVVFVDLSAYPEFFEDMNKACVSEISILEDLSLGEAPAFMETTALEVHEVGDFEASFVPRMQDFYRLDPRFQLPADVWVKMPDYSDYGFTVFQLKLSALEEIRLTGQMVHPMAFEFPTRDENRLFYPTVHVHDRDYHPQADFDHSLYCQRDDAREQINKCWYMLHQNQVGSEQIGNWYRKSRNSAADEMDTPRCPGVLQEDVLLHALDLHGRYPNRDIWIG
jgi:hypothetical protein